MEKEDLEKKLGALKGPDAKSGQHYLQLKIALLNAKRSARAGIFLVLIPCLFLSFIFLKYILHIHIPPFTKFEDWMADKNNNVFIKVLFPLLLLFAPLGAFIINMLAILHFDFSKHQKELLVTIKLKWLNIVIIIISAAILFCFMLYAVGENL